MGLDPDRFWRITLRLVALELAGAEMRQQRDRENIWFSAMLPYLEKPPTLAQFAGGKPDPKERAKDFNERWDRIDRALARSTG